MQAKELASAKALRQRASIWAEVGRQEAETKYSPVHLREKTGLGEVRQELRDQICN